ncbi:MAG TPA: ATP-binding cassette domain-containing protein [Methanothrix sp.]|nr:ATP-binding cassette domain-containing protein [Methanothrix sp.]HON35898.1 ATP-binding cassette domain-containing protein [Methanothrix sp.]HON36408.1 ATP-binding cassette domain-containing protein [Methanothrix sp.]HRU75604.1 ATP-binding cassette domain-containing protein [Methanothrix sp.]
MSQTIKERRIMSAEEELLRAEERRGLKTDDHPLTLTIQGGVDKNGHQDLVPEIEICRGEIIGIVGPTGSGKSTLIADIEQFALGDTPSGRSILINGQVPENEQRYDPRKKLVAQLSQNMHFLADMQVGEFLRMHAKSRGKDPHLAEKVIELANTLTGEPISPEFQLTILSGGQSRALMVADIAVISDSPIVLIDEIENAGIKKQEALRLLSGEGKIVAVVTHDPMLALMATRRIVMKNGGMVKVISTSDEEQRIFKDIERVDGWLTGLRETIRQGEVVA